MADRVLDFAVGQWRFKCVGMRGTDGTIDVVRERVPTEAWRAVQTGPEVGILAYRRALLSLAGEHGKTEEDALRYLLEGDHVRAVLALLAVIELELGK